MYVVGPGFIFGRITLCYNQPMKRELMDILVCPVCKGELELTVEEENEKEIVTGALLCAKCDVRYPITDTIPNLLPPE
jgi:uncharacterized protein YbaR (Trm112 family)